MDIIEAMQKRHSVRSYLDKPIAAEKSKKLRSEIAACNAEGNLNFQLVTDEERAFGGMMAHYGKFSGVKNYVALVGKKTDDLQERTGYFGERLALFAQTLGLNTCWVALTYKKVKSAFSVGKGEKLVCVLAIGYGATDGAAHKSKPAAQVSEAQNAPEWFLRGVEAALLAPTAMNQQKFKFILNGRGVRAKSGGGFYTKTDLGIAKYHFEVGAGRENFEWE